VDGEGEGGGGGGETVEPNTRWKVAMARRDQKMRVPVRAPCGILPRALSRAPDGPPDGPRRLNPPLYTDV